MQDFVSVFAGLLMAGSALLADPAPPATAGASIQSAVQQTAQP